MKLKKYRDKSKSKRKVLLISLGVIVLVGVSFMLYKTFAIFTENVEFPMMNGKVDYFGNSDVYFYFYNGDTKISKMPQLDNDEDLVFDFASCDNGAEVTWNEEEWGPLVTNLNGLKNRCELHFKKGVNFAKEVVKCGQAGTSAVECMNANASYDKVNLGYDGKESLGEELGTDDNNLRYIGANPNNYVSFNDGELWRIIGIMDGKLKIIRSEPITNREWDSDSNSYWQYAGLNSYLNDEYSINSDLVVETNWNAGICGSSKAQGFYNYEKNITSSGRIGLISASDYGYAVGGSDRTTCLSYDLRAYDDEKCLSKNWLFLSNNYIWTLTATLNTGFAYAVTHDGIVLVTSVGYHADIFPVVYLKESTRITGGTGRENNPYILE